MERDYADGIDTNVVLFTGIEVENTPANGLLTLFVTGVRPIAEIMQHYHDNGCKHIYLGANQSFDPSDSTASQAWDTMIRAVVATGELITFDFDVKHVEWVLEGGYSEHDNFIPQISVKIPYLRQFNYNATVKIDDKDFKASNPGVWCHSLHELQSRTSFTPWSSYGNDRILQVGDTNEQS